ncbi:hypothetical protein BAUCODRAFT_400084 [Baudoinia panamericana UAMH 10762]|uniref:Uncharacterized protein n=1 Tax=Baudoinia panamericana (strain UAMH 10762) TaxID=717646 RepID=M2N5P0_BAUPA|nr:uncharacterized protein BAUCODRAFT_400084 [Baudoinia panamericana UAMH 10762]EMC99348.1 hypothetical protein BAUCODRAFT_400084 [Baudoinia panamericana UAMH 10762]
MDKPTMHELWDPVDAGNPGITLTDLADAAAKAVPEGEVDNAHDRTPCPRRERPADRAPAYEKGVQTALEYLFNGRDIDARGPERGSALAADGDLRPDVARDKAKRMNLFHNRRGLRGVRMLIRDCCEGVDHD